MVTMYRVIQSLIDDLVTTIPLGVWICLLSSLTGLIGASIIAWISIHFLQVAPTVFPIIMIGGGVAGLILGLLGVVQH